MPPKCIPVTRRCASCGAEYNVAKPSINRRYCSRQCWPHLQRTPDERFWSKVAIVDDPVSCWPWTGMRYANGYGRFSEGRAPVYAHRFIWRVKNGPIPKGKYVCHRCDNPPCVRPDHLFLGSPSDNVRDMLTKGRSRPGGARGERHAQSKLTAPKVLELRQRVADGETLFSFFTEYGVTYSTAWSAVTRKYWKHV